MKREVKYKECDEEIRDRSTASNSSESEMGRDGRKELNRSTRLLRDAGNRDHSSGEEDLPEKSESTPRNERDIESSNGNVSEENSTQSSAGVSDAAKNNINDLSQDDKRETENGQEPSDVDFVPSVTEQKAKHVISLSNHSESEDGHESQTKLNATVSSESDAEYQLMRKIMKRKKRIMDSDSDPSSDAEFIKQRKMKKLDTETSSQNEYESLEPDSGDKKKTGQKKTFMKKRYREVTKSNLRNRVNYRNYSTGSDDNSEKVSSQSEPHESDQRDRSKNTQNSESDPDDTSDDEEKSSRREKKKDGETSNCDSRRSESRDKDDSTLQESSDSDKENKTKSQIKNGTLQDTQ